MDNDLRTGLVVEAASEAHDNTPRFANDLGASRDGNGVSDEVLTSIEEDDLAAGILGELISTRT